ncbi:MAG: asparagine synthase B [Clostridia bacterium]|nr:asparagine synthase B [Clostridia bacterium]
MCSIMGYEGSAVSTEDFIKGFDETKSRGPDMSRVVDTGGGIIAFHRLAIMGLDETGMQPFRFGGLYLVCNGELYGFRKTKRELEAKGYTFVSDSDCELILPLYCEYGFDMFSMLDAEFAMIIYDSEKKRIVAARDPFGIRPLYYGYDREGEIVFASEPKNLVPICTGIMPFPPGHYYADGEFVCYRDISTPRAKSNDGVEDASAKIHDLLISAVEKRLDSDSPVGFLLSGGLDSSLVCAIAAKHSQKLIKTFAIGMSKDAIDLRYAKEVADYIGSEHTEVIITERDAIDALPDVVKLLGTFDITTIRASVGMYLVCKYIHENTDLRVILTGEISDELFGYKYTDFAPSPEEFQREAEKRVRELHMYDVLRADRCISVNSLEARVPFGDLAFAEYVMSLDPKIKMNVYGKGKYLLRHAFEGDLLPRDILMREKAAFSDAVGHSMVDCIKRYAEEYYTDAEFEEKRAAYDYSAPFTKESLLYRELFERFYPNCARMIAGFWMPNRTWEGCDVDDPSARVLSNYGDSGK